MIAAAINTHAIAKMGYSSVLAAVAVAVVFSIAILGVARSSEMRREHGTAPPPPRTPRSRPRACSSPPRS